MVGARAVDAKRPNGSKQKGSNFLAFFPEEGDQKKAKGRKECLFLHVKLFIQYIYAREIWVMRRLVMLSSFIIELVIA